MPTQGTQRGDSHRLALSHFTTNSSKGATRQVGFFLFLAGSSLDVIPYAAVLESVFRKSGARRSLQMPSVAAERERVRA